MKKILAIEDNVIDPLVYNLIFEKNFPDYKIITAKSGKEGITKACNEKPDTILLDIVMPDMDGYGICKELKESELTKRIPIIFLTAPNVNTKERIRGYELGVGAFVTKPIDPSELSAQIWLMLKIKESEDKRLADKINFAEKTIQHFKGKEWKTNQQLQEEIIERKNIERELKKSHNKLLELSMHIEEVREKERTKIALDLHDDLGQKLTGLNFYLASIAKVVSMDDPVISKKINSMSELLNDTIRTVQKLSTELRPRVLDDIGLASAIEWQLNEFNERTGISYKTSLLPDEFEIDPSISILVFRIVQETLTNVARHSKATLVEISLLDEDDKLKLEIKDNGIGISAVKIESADSFGLLGMQERARWGGGTATITGQKGKGTTISVTMPIKNSGGQKR